MVFKIDSTKTPSKIDFIDPKGKQETVLGIYNLEDDWLVFGLPLGDQQKRPSKLMAKDPFTYLLLFKRIQKEKKLQP